MMLHLPSENALFVLAVLLAFGALCGQLAKRMNLPSVTGQILAGIILGPSVLHVSGHEALQGLRPIIHFALGLIAVDVGTHLHLRRLRNSFRRLGTLLLLEITLTPFLVYLALVLGAGRDWTFGVLFGALAISTAPATVLAIVKETRSKGVYVRTLIAAVALNNIACITLFEMASSAVKVTLDPTASTTTMDVLMAPLIQLGGAALLGGVVGLALVLGTKHVIQTEQVTTVSIISIFLTTGLADFFAVSNLLACLFLGVTIANLAPEKEEIGHRVFANFEPAVLAVFFTLAGMGLDFGFLATGWVLVALFVVSRGLGKVWSGQLAMRLAKGTVNVRRYLGLGLIPQAGVAVGLLLQLRDDPVFDPVSSVVLAVGVASVAVNEIVGPITTRWAMARSGNLGQDRPRLIDFIHEENIITDFQAESKEEAMGKLVDLMISSHGLQVDREDFLGEIMARETIMSSCIGRGLAVPHGCLADGQNLVGVMGISKVGLPLESPDGLPLRCLVLLAAPPEDDGRFMEVQGVLARNLGSNWALQLQLYNAKTPAHVYEILHAEEFEDFNYFLDGPEEI
jgi:Kef-type K+ transport system membrane component KefB/mannitol/fructose-specific phosphotransferase system IIA component (Ntr-type)|nr:cation:proton antiporter [Candidatus Krumholzibacteria bacterium]